VQGSDLAYAALAVNPIGGILVAIPFATFKLGYPIWLCVASGVPLTYVQVLVADGAWDLLQRVPACRRFLERSRSARLERLVAARGLFLPTVILAPLVGPWAVMVTMRYLQVPQRRVALPILLGIAWIATLIAALCVAVPERFARG
jgi:hypothetical protein